MASSLATVTARSASASAHTARTLDRLTGARRRERYL
jgi:hypothetical protein